MTTTATVNSSPITATVSSGVVSANVTSSGVSASASGGVGPQGPTGPAGEAGSGGSTTDASLLTSGTLSAARLPASVVLTSDSRLSDARTPTTHSHAVSDVTGLQTALDSKQASGSYAAASHTHTASDIASGTIATARLASGTADSTTYLRGDQTWATVAAGSSSASDLTSGTLSQARLDFVPIHPFLLMGG